MAHMNHSSNNQTIWHDDCPECTERSEALPGSLGDLDDRNRIKAWHFMRAYRWSGGDWQTRPASFNDRKLFDCLYSIAVFMQRAGFEPGEIEERMCRELEAQLIRAGSMGIDWQHPPAAEFFGINTTGIFVGPA